MTREIGRQRRLELHRRATDGMGEREASGMQEHPLQTGLRQFAVPREIAVLVVARERKAQMREMDADLMRAAGQELGLEQRERRIVIAPGLDAPERRRGIATEVVVDTHTPLAFACRELVQREAHRALLVAPMTLHQ